MPLFDCPRVPPDARLDFADPKLAQRYARTVRGGSMQFGAFLKRLATLPVGTRALDVGAGPGALTVEVAARYPRLRVTALEPSPALAEFGRAHVAARNLAERVTYVAGSGADAELMASLGTFDLVFSTFALHFLPDAAAGLGLMVKAAGATGTVYIHDMRRVWWLYWGPKDAGFFDSLRASFSLEELQRLAAPYRGCASVTARLPFLADLIVAPERSRGA